MIRILLVNPPASPVNLIAHFAAEDLKQQLGRLGIVGPPHSLCALAGNLRDFEVEIFDLKAEPAEGPGLEEAVRQKLAEFGPDIVGVTFVTSEYTRGCRILELAKQYNPRALTVAGGVHATLCPEDFDLPYVDITVYGPGKKIFREVAAAYANKGDIRGIPNISFRRNGRRYHTKRINLFRNSEDLLSSVYSDRSLIRKYRDAYRVGPEKKPIGFIETSLGCPSRCSFCSIWPVNGGNYFERPVEDVIGELKTMEEYSVVRFVDANTMGDVVHAGVLFERIVEEQLEREFVMDVRADTALHHPELIRKAAEAGLKVAIVGIESEDEDELEFYNKESSRDIVLGAIEVLRRNNVNIRGICIVQPDYDENDFERLDRFLQENGLTHSAFSIMTPFPGTPLYLQVRDSIVIKDLSYYNLFNSVFDTKLPAEDFYRLTAELFRDKQGIR